jgi:hypothetical protein
MWDLQGGPTRLESWVARRPLRAGLLHGVGLGVVLALIDQSPVHPWTNPAAVVVYSVLVYVRAKEHQAALRFYRRGGSGTALEGNGRAPEPKHPALRAVYWREEILGVGWWLRGEGGDDSLHPDVLGRFLGLGPTEAAKHLEQLAGQGSLQRRRHGHFGLTQVGEDEGRRIAAGDRAVPPPTSGPCGPECWCSTSPLEASRCGPGQLG